MKFIPASILAIASIAFYSCNNEGNTQTELISTDSGKIVENKIMIPNSFCYSYISGKDTVKLKMDKFPNVVTGTLAYNFYEKDSNKGEIDGVLHGDTLMVDYKYRSEGVTSVRQVAFLVKADKATEGYGAMEEKDGKMIFKNTNELDFSKGIILQKVDCPVE